MAKYFYLNKKRYDSDGHSRGVVRFPDLPDPIKLKWDFNKKVIF